MSVYMANFSVLMSIYYKESSLYFDECMRSLYNQSLKPNQIVLVKDGVLTPELEQVILVWREKLGDVLKIVALDTNVGLGRALNIGLEHCIYDWVFRMDTDDICVPERFKKQVEFIINNPNIDIVGGQIIEFEKQINDSQTIKSVPINHQDIIKYAKARNPINHMTVAFKKSAVQKVGGYRHAPLYEDYDLWVRLLLNQYQFANLSDVLVYARAGNAMYERRGGLNYIKSEIQIQKRFYTSGFLTTFQMCKNLAIRLPVRLLPNGIRAWIYQVLLRK